MIRPPLVLESFKEEAKLNNVNETNVVNIFRQLDEARDFVVSVTGS